ncbi:MAG: ribosomal-processing cysteine protease Prp [Lachnospiraceae bacterium]|nr:ribosomal-processing cysteine protease Prp [Lachnospiraceae bacterium]
MIRVDFYYEDKELCGFHIHGHSEYADPGKDIVCSAISALSFNCVNSLEVLSKDRTSVEQESNGNLFCIVKRPISPEGQLLLRSLQLGAENIAKEYPRYVTISTKE